eukprot:2121704-Rhodomonas_salina.1
MSTHRTPCSAAAPILASACRSLTRVQRAAPPNNLNHHFALHLPPSGAEPTREDGRVVRDLVQLRYDSDALFVKGFYKLLRPVHAPAARKRVLEERVQHLPRHRRVEHIDVGHYLLQVQVLAHVGPLFDHRRHQLKPSQSHSLF